MNKVAVITRTKNRPIMLPRVLASLRRQAFKDFLWVLVNDAGEETSVNRVATEARESGIEVQVIHRPKSIGMEAASNDGIARSQSELIVIHDDDDTWEPLFLKRTVDYLDTNVDIPGVITWANRVNETIKGDVISIENSHPYNHWMLNIYLSDMAVENRFPPISFLFRRSIYNEIGGFDESLPVLGDWDFHLRVLLEGDIHVLPEGLANYHFRQNSDAGSVYGNTVTTGVDKHILYDAKYRNRMLRKDLKEGKHGIGMLLAMGQMFRRVNHASDKLAQIGQYTRDNRVLATMRKIFRV